MKKEVEDQNSACLTNNVGGYTDKIITAFSILIPKKRKKLHVTRSDFNDTKEKK